MPDMAAQELRQTLNQAAKICQQRGVRLTRQRARVLEILCSSDRPLGAYDILEAIRSEVPRAAPPTAYRALDFLLQQGLIHKLETLHAYLGCRHPEHPHAGQFLICSECGDVTELEDDAIQTSVGRAAAASGFIPSHRVVEVTGTCADCSSHKQ